MNRVRKIERAGFCAKSVWMISARDLSAVGGGLPAPNVVLRVAFLFFVV